MPVALPEVSTNAKDSLDNSNNNNTTETAVGSSQPNNAPNAKTCPGKIE